MEGPAHPAIGPAPKERPPARSSTSKPPVKSTGNSSAVPDDGISSVPLLLLPRNRSVPSLPTSAPIRPAAIQAQSDIAPPADNNATAINHGNTSHIHIHNYSYGNQPYIAAHAIPPPLEQPYVNGNGSSANEGFRPTPLAQELALVGAQASQTSSEPSNDLRGVKRGREHCWRVFHARRKTRVIIAIVILVVIVGAVLGSVLGSRKKEDAAVEAAGGSADDLEKLDGIITTPSTITTITTNGGVITSDLVTTRDTTMIVSRTSATEPPKPTTSTGTVFTGTLPTEGKWYRIFNDDDKIRKVLTVSSSATGIDQVRIASPSSKLNEHWQFIVAGDSGEALDGRNYWISNLAIGSYYLIADEVVEGQNRSTVRLGLARANTDSMWLFTEAYTDKEKKALLGNVMVAGALGWDGEKKAEMQFAGYRQWYLEEVAMVSGV